MCTKFGEECGGSTNSVSVYSLPGISKFKNIGCFTGTPTNSQVISVSSVDVWTCQAEALASNKRYVGVRKNGCLMSDEFPQGLSYSRDCDL
jgi:hypothetical protein